MSDIPANGRYLLFAGAHYYPRGGWDDFKGVFETVEAAKAALGQVGESEWWQVVDRTTLKVVE